MACADVAADTAGETAERIEADGGKAMALPCDVSVESESAAAVEAAVEQFGRLDSLVNAAGILSTGHTHETDLTEWNRVLTVNLTGTFLVTRRALPYLLNGGGAIVNLASTAALGGHPWMAAYSASKGGILAFTRTLAVEYGRQGLRANAVGRAGSRPTSRRRSAPRGRGLIAAERISPLDDFRGPASTAARSPTWPRTTPPTSTAPASPSTAARWPDPQQRGAHLPSVRAPHDIAPEDDERHDHDQES